ncbi:MAG: glycosyltransferase family 1 protein, partial [Deltaproteobacteria bacterium]
WTWGARERHFKNLLPRAARIITGTGAGKEEIIKYYQVPENLVQVVPFPTPQFALSPPVTEEQQAGESQIPENYLFYPAQFWPHKNHVGLLLALKILRDKFGLNFNLVFTGSDKGNLGYVQKMVKELGLEDKVTFLGFVETDFLRELYRRAFALVFPTFLGPDNLPPLEAFALGCPVIASNVEGAEEQLGSAALLFDPKNPEEMALRIKELHDSPAIRDELIRLGHERALSWTAKDYVERMLQIIDDFAPIRRCWE